MNFIERRRQHFTNLRGNYHNNPYLQNSYNYYGEDAFEVIVIEEIETDRDGLLAREQEWLDCFKWEYNLNPVAILPPSTAGRKHTEETRQKIRGALNGKRHSEERKLNSSKAHSSLKFGEVILVRRMLANGFSQRFIGKCFGVSHGTIGAINTRKRYTWVANE